MKTYTLDNLRSKAALSGNGCVTVSIEQLNSVKSEVLNTMDERVGQRAANLSEAVGEYQKEISKLRAELAKAQGCEEVLSKILDDATGDAGNFTRHLWPLRAENYREAKRLLDARRPPELKPCPFCGGEPFMDDDDDGCGRNVDYAVKCSKCPVRLDWCDTREEAQNAWNTRA
jgi:Lar family restriction alleviation protein